MKRPCESLTSFTTSMTRDNIALLKNIKTKDESLGNSQDQASRFWSSEQRRFSAGKGICRQFPKIEEEEEGDGEGG